MANTLPFSCEYRSVGMERKLREVKKSRQQKKLSALPPLSQPLNLEIQIPRLFKNVC